MCTYYCNDTVLLNSRNGFFFFFNFCFILTLYLLDIFEFFCLISFLFFGGFGVRSVKPSVKLIQLSDDPWYSGLLMKIHIIDPYRIIVPHTIYEAKPETSDGKLVKFIREEFPKLPIIKVSRHHFSETDGMDVIKKYCSDKYNYIKEELKSKYYALSATAGLLKYLQFIENIYFKENGLKLEFETKFAHMQIGKMFFFCMCIDYLFLFIHFSL